MNDIKVLIEQVIKDLGEAKNIEITSKTHGLKSISLVFPTNVYFDIHCCFYSVGNGYTLSWDDGIMVHRDISFTKEDFNVLYVEVLKELMKRNGGLK